MSTIKLTRRKYRESLHDFGFGSEILDDDLKAQSIEEIKLSWTLSILKISALWKILLRDEKINYKLGESICKSYIYIYIIENLYQE